MSLAGRIAAGICIFAAVLVTTALLGGSFVRSQVESALLTLYRDNATGAAQAVLERSEKVLSVHAKTIGRDRAAVAALAARDSRALEDGLTSTFNRISAAGEMSDLLIYDADQVLRLSLSVAGDKAPETPNQVVQEVFETGRRVFAMSQISDTRYAASYAFPLLQGRNKVGVAVVALDVMAALPDIAVTTGGSVLLAQRNPAGGAAVVHGKAGPVFAQPEEQDENTQAAIGTDPADYASAAFAALAENSNSVASFPLRENVFVVARETLGSLSGGSELLLLLTTDFTDEQEAKNAAIRIQLIAVAAIVVVCLGLFLLWFRGQMRPLRSITAALMALSRGETPEAQVHRRAAREITALGQAFEAFALQADKLAEESRKAEEQAAEIAAQAEKLKEQAQRDALKQKAETERLAEESRRTEETRRKEQETAAEIAAVVDACAQGDFSRRLVTDDKSGIFAELCEGMNRIGSSAKEGLDAVEHVLDAISKGDLSRRMPDRFQGRFREIGLKLNATSDKLAEMVQQISGSTDTVQSSAREMAAAADDLAMRTEASAAALEETSAAVEELTASVAASAKTARGVSAKAQVTEADVAQGLTVSENTVNAMQEISKSSEEISKITNVIDGIAFQTNLLALNAGVEAARAGEAGRGFAVVASEVRALAQRSAEAAQDIKNLISISGTQVRNGVDLVKQSRKGLEAIRNSIFEMTKDVEHVAEATVEQSSGIEEINAAVGTLEQDTQKNAAMFEEMNAVVQTMHHEAGTLVQAVAQFSVEAVQGASEAQEGDVAFSQSRLAS